MSAPTSRAWLITLVIALAVLLHAPNLTWGFYADDYGQQLVLEGHADEFRSDTNAHMRPWSLYDFGYAPTPTSTMAAQGFYPWWTPADWKLRFFRPLASATHVLDQALFGRAAALHHALSLAYFATLLVVLHAFYRAAGLAPRVALIALAIFGFDDSSLIPVGWLANRNALIECLFAVSAALIAMRTRERPTLPSVIASYALALGACLCKESGVVAPVLVALIYASGRASRLAIVTGPLLSVGYFAFLLLADFGSRSAFYPTPWFESSVWLSRALQMAAFTPLSVAAPNPFDLAVFHPSLLTGWLAVSLALGVPLVIALVRARSTLPHATFFALWIALTLLPQAGAPPSERLLFVPMVGAAPWLANFIERLFTTSSWRARIAPALVGFTSIALSGLSLAARGASFGDKLVVPLREAVLSAATPHEHVDPQTVIVLQSPSQIAMLAPASAWIFLTGDRGVRFAPMQWGRRGLRWRVIDERTYELTSLDEPFLDSAFEPVFLSSTAPPPAGTHWRAASFEVEAVEPDARGLRTIRVRLDAPLSDPRWRFVTWRAGRFQPVEPPAIGASLELPRCPPLDPLMP